MLAAFFARLTEHGIKVNKTHRDVRGGRFVWMKVRRPFATVILQGVNFFFRWASSPVRAIGGGAEWQRWELSCFEALHGPDNFLALAEGPHGVCADELPGKNLTLALDGGTLTPAMTAAAGRELRRAHGWHCPMLNALWSHGDAHAGNFIYDARRDRARIIDFEMRHSRLASPEVRHVDDVLAFLQDLAGRCQPAQWLPCAEAFLAAYQRPDLWPLLQKQLRIPSWSPARVWWEVRCSFLPSAELQRRLEELHQSPLFAEQTANTAAASSRMPAFAAGQVSPANPA